MLVMYNQSLNLIVADYSIQYAVGKYRTSGNSAGIVNTPLPRGGGASRYPPLAPNPPFKFSHPPPPLPPPSGTVLPTAAEYHVPKYVSAD